MSWLWTLTNLTKIRTGCQIPRSRRNRGSHNPWRVHTPEHGYNRPLCYGGLLLSLLLLFCLWGCCGCCCFVVEVDAFSWWRWFAASRMKSSRANCSQPLPFSIRFAVSENNFPQVRQRDHRLFEQRSKGMLRRSSRWGSQRSRCLEGCRSKRNWKSEFDCSRKSLY